MPTIKCSICGNQVEISRMGDHICGAPVPECMFTIAIAPECLLTRAVSPPPENDEVFGRHPGKSLRNKYERTPSPVETGSSGEYNSSFAVRSKYILTRLGNTLMHRGQLTPVSQPSYSRSTSPVRQEKSYNTNAQDSRSTSHARNRSQDLWEERTAAASRRPGGYGGFGESRKETSDRYGADSFMSRRNNAATAPNDPSQRPPASAKNAFPSRKESLDKWPSPAEERIAPPVPRKDGYEGFGPPRGVKKENQGYMSRSETVPILSPRNDLPEPQSPSMGGPYSSQTGTNGGYGHARKKSMGPDTTRRPPPRTSLLSEPKRRNADSVDLAAEFGVGNPYHTPSDSSSSGYSDFSSSSQTTAATSPDRSQFFKSDRDWEMGKYGQPEDDNRPSASRPDAPRRTADLDGRSGGAPTGNYRAPPFSSGYLSSPGNDYNEPYKTRRDDSATGRMGPPPPRRQNAWDRQPPPARAPAPSRGNCKACGIAITGKSISSADGRLTGKYHKTCFVCTTCSEPFSSSVFYVLDDKPYCGQHYHKLNNSLCGSCGSGIEGHFAEDEAKVKYHVDCFRCLDCGESLADGYFEVDGRAYCERDAWKRVQSQPYAEPEISQAGASYGAVNARTSKGLPSRPSRRAGQETKPFPPLPAGLPNNDRLGAGSDRRLRMNKRMTRLGNMKF